MPWQTTIQLQGQTYLGCRVSLNCMWSHSVESKGRERDPHADCATPCISTFTQGFNKIRKTTKTRGGVYPVEVLQSFPLPHNTYCILYKLVWMGEMDTAY